MERDDGVEDPVEAEERIDGHGEVVHPYFLVAEGLAEERVFGAGVAERPVVVDVPEAGVDGVYSGEGDEEGAVGGCLFDAVDAEGYVEDDCCDVFSPVEQMREGVTGVVVAAEALDCSPYSRECGEEPE